MTQSLSIDPGPAPVSRRMRALLAIVASLVILAVLSCVELGALAFLAVVSSAVNHGAS